MAFAVGREIEKWAPTRTHLLQMAKSKEIGKMLEWTRTYGSEFAENQQFGRLTGKKLKIYQGCTIYAVMNNIQKEGSQQLATPLDKQKLFIERVSNLPFAESIVFNLRMDQWLSKSNAGSYSPIHLFHHWNQQILSQHLQSSLRNWSHLNHHRWEIN